MRLARESGVRELAGRSVSARGRIERVRDASVLYPGPALLGRLRAALARVPLVSFARAHRRSRSQVRADWIVHATGRARKSASQSTIRVRACGARHIVAAEVRVRASGRTHLAQLEAVTGGWLLLVPTGHGRGLVQAMVPHAPTRPRATLRDVLAEARHLATPRVTRARVVSFAAAPSLLEIPTDETGSWSETRPWRSIRSTEAASAQIRGAILAAAMLDGITRGLDRRGALEYYAARLRGAFVAHLARWARSYDTAPFTGQAWSTERAGAHRALASLRRRKTPWRLRLVGLRLAQVRARTRGRPAATSSAS